MDILNFIIQTNWIEVLSNPLSWIPAFLIAVVLVLVILSLTDELTSLISNAFTYIRIKYILVIPIKPIQVWLLEQQLKTAEINKEIWVSQIEKIKSTINK